MFKLKKKKTDTLDEFKPGEKGFELKKKRK